MTTPRRGAGADDAVFAGSIPDVYERLLVPLIFAEPAARLARALAAWDPLDVLETAAGTGAATRALRERLPAARITATDLNEAMLALAREQRPVAGVRWQRADATSLPFEDASFDAVVCQFGVMFFPDRRAALTEARRVLRPQGVVLFNVWESLHANPAPAVVAGAVAEAAGESPPQFLARTPYGYHDHHELEADAAAAGLTVRIESCAGVNRGTAHDVATAFCQGTPLRAEIEAHPRLDLAAATAAAAEALARSFGDGVIELPSRWLQIEARPKRGTA